MMKQSADIERLVEKRLKPIIEPLAAVKDVLTSNKGVTMTSRKMKKEEISTQSAEAEELEEDDMKQLEMPGASRELFQTTPSLLEVENNDDDGDAYEQTESESYHHEPVYSPIAPTTTQLSSRKSLTQQSSVGKMAKLYTSRVVNGLEHDTVYGVHYDPKHEKWTLGTKDVMFDDNSDIIIGGKKYKGTKGLYELLFLPNPDKVFVHESDMREYAEILESTSAHLNKLGYVKSNSGKKYKEIISVLFPSKSSQKPFSPNTSTPKGSGMMIQDSNAPIKYVYWNDADELCDRLRLLITSKRTGHTGHDGEIASIIEELKEIGVIIGGELKL